MEFLTFIVAVVALFLSLRGNSRLKKLETLARGKSVRGLDQIVRVAPPSAINGSPGNLGANQDQVRAGAWVPPPAPARSDASERFVAWLKEDWLMKMGGLLLLIGFGWLTTYAFLHNWIGPVGRITLGICAGAVLLILGFWRIKKYVSQGGVFLVIGSTIILLTVFAGRVVYDFFTPISALLIMFLSTVFVGVASVKYRSGTLSMMGLVLAFVAPLLTGSVDLRQVYIFAYLLAVLLGVVWASVMTGKRGLNIAALIAITLYSLPYLTNEYSYQTMREIVLLFAYAYSAILFVASVMTFLRSADGRDLRKDLVVAGGNGLFLLLWIWVAVRPEWKSLIISAWMIVFALGAFIVYRISRRKEPFYINAAVAVALLAAATAAELHGAELTIAYAVESAAVMMVLYGVVRKAKAALGASFILLGPALLSLGSIAASSWSTSVFHKDFFVLFVMAAVLMFLGLFLGSRLKAEPDRDTSSGNHAAAFTVIGSIYAYALLWLSLKAAFQNDDTAVMISLLIYTITGLAVYFFGLKYESGGLRVYGGLLLGFVVGRLLLVDVWRMELSGRIVTFFAVGALLLGTAFFGRKKKNSNPELINRVSQNQ